MGGSLRRGAGAGASKNVITLKLYNLNSRARARNGERALIGERALSARSARNGQSISPLRAGARSFSLAFFLYLSLRARISLIANKHAMNFFFQTLSFARTRALLLI